MECGNGINGIDSQRHIFSAVVACLSGFRGQERSRIYDHIIRGGGTVTTFLTQRCTHLITSELRGAKCHTAISLPKIKIVSYLWFKRSVTNGRKEKEDGYDARALTDLISAPIPLVDILNTHGKQVQYVNQCILSATACRMCGGEPRRHIGDKLTLPRCSWACASTLKKIPLQARSW